MKERNLEKMGQTESKNINKIKKKEKKLLKKKHIIEIGFHYSSWSLFLRILGEYRTPQLFSNFLQTIENVILFLFDENSETKGSEKYQAPANPNKTRNSTFLPATSGSSN